MTDDPAAAQPQALHDICDPNPTFVLTSITSSEADDGLADGDTSADVQDASTGTTDTEFRLRAERSGRGTGRVYTIVYTASDRSGYVDRDGRRARAAAPRAPTRA